MRPKHAENKEHEPSPQGSGYQHVRRTFCRQATDIAGKDRNECPRTCSSERGIENNDLELGIGYQQAHCQRHFPETCGRTWSQSPHSIAGKIIQNSQFLEDSENFSKISALEIQGSKGFSGRIFGKIPKIGYLAIDTIPNSGYNARVIQNGSPNHLEASYFRPVLNDIKTLRIAGLFVLTT